MTPSIQVLPELSTIWGKRESKHVLAQLKEENSNVTPMFSAHSLYFFHVNLKDTDLSPPDPIILTILLYLFLPLFLFSPASCSQSSRPHHSTLSPSSCCSFFTCLPFVLTFREKSALFMIRHYFSGCCPNTRTGCFGPEPDILGPLL